MKPRYWLTTAAACLVALFFMGCATYFGRRQAHRSSNLYQYLYSDQAAHTDAPGMATLNLPLRVGVAFVPPDAGKDRIYYESPDASFTEAQKMELLKKVADQFKSNNFVRSIEIIPTTYLAPRGGFANLEQLARMYSLDVMALVSYDQVQFTDQGLLSLTYWTIVGAYVVQGEKNETRTMLDAAVYDINSRRLLFRAPGVSSVKERSTPINLTEELRAHSAKGFDAATTNLIANLKAQLDDFRERVKASPTEYKVVNRPGYKGAGSFGSMEVAMAALAAAGIWIRRQKRN